MAPGFPSCRNYEVPQDISFSGSGFLSTYQLGVALCLLNHAAWILRSAPCILGSSAGSLIAAAVVCEINLLTIRDEILLLTKQVVTLTLGPFHPGINVFRWLKSILDKYLPSDAHRLASGRLGVAMTRLKDGKHFIMSEFQSREDLIQALLCSCYVPGHSGFRPPTFKGVHYIDGGLTGIQPRLPAASGRTLTVCPFSGDADICPADPSCMMEMVVGGGILKFSLANSYRILNGLYPVALETIEQAFHSGYKDGIGFLRSNYLVKSVVSNTLSQVSLKCDQTKTWMPLETTQVEEMERETKLPDSEATRDFDVVNNAHLITDLSEFGPYKRIVYSLLLSLMVLFDVSLQTRNRLGLLFREMPDLIFWTWLSLRHCSVFFFNIIISTIKKNVTDRVMPIMFLLQWIKVQEL
ncbi:unnamed protein product [Menidia menidia]|uniref:(Atlantic silverside) hypothetical protein n=1 Tax=Menidia menidia TaxID=238744 RepID=A0A8S4BQZ4_9TELE|nr:unnamed protein product [Menidia menidia]